MKKAKKNIKKIRFFYDLIKNKKVYERSSIFLRQKKSIFIDLRTFT